MRAACGSSQLVADGAAFLEQLVGAHEYGVVALDGHAPVALGLDLQLAPFPATDGFAQAVLQDQFEACFGVALVGVATVLMLLLALAVAHREVEAETDQGDDGGDTGATAQVVPDWRQVSLIESEAEVDMPKCP